MNATDSLRLSCPKCAATVRAPAALAGKRVKCPKCGGAIKVPGAAVVAGDDDDWLSLDDPLPKSVSGAAVPKNTGTAGSSPPNNPPTQNPSPQNPSPQNPLNERDWFDDLPPLASPPAATGGRSAGHSGGVPALTPAEEAALTAAGGFDFDDAGTLKSGQRKPAPLKPEQQIREPIKPASPATAQPRRGNPDVGKPSAGTPATGSPATGNPAVGPAGNAPPSGRAAAPAEYRVKCPVCASVLFVRPQQAGRSIRCSDCHSQFVVPAPPPLAVAKPKVDLDRVATFQLSEPAGTRDLYGAPGSKSAAEYLRAAEDAEVEVDLSNEYDNPDMMGWLRGIFGIFTDPSVAAYWLMLSMLGAIPGMIAVAIGHPVVLLISLTLMVLYGSLVVACGFAIMETVAGGQRRVDEWPVFNPAEWIGQALTAIAAIALSGIPGAVVGYALFGPHLGSVALIMFTVFLLFPYVLLSMLDNGTPFMPVSSEVTKSVTRCKEAWGSLYFSSMLLFFFQFVAVAVLALMPPIVAVFFNCVLWVGLVFVYFAMIGRLAFQIGQPIKEEPEED